MFALSSFYFEHLIQHLMDTGMAASIFPEGRSSALVRIPQWSVASGPSQADDSTVGKFFFPFVCLLIPPVSGSWLCPLGWLTYPLTGLAGAHCALTSSTLVFSLGFSNSCGWNVTLGPLLTWAVLPKTVRS